MASISWTAAAVTIFVSTLGMGILGIPEAFHLLGYIFGFIISALIATITGFSLYFLGKAATSKSSKSEGDSFTYPGLGARISPVLKVTINLALFGSNFGTMLIISRSLVFNASELLYYFFVRWFASLSIDLVRYTIASLHTMIVSIFLSRSKPSTLTSIARISMIIVTFYSILISFYGIFYGQPLPFLNSTTILQLSVGLSKIIFAFHCQFSCLSIFYELLDKSESSIIMVCVLTSVLIFLVYAGTGFFGYKLCAGDIAGKDLLSMLSPGTVTSEMLKKDSFDKHGVLPYCLRIAFLFVLFGTVVFSAIPIIPLAQDLLSACNISNSRSTVSFLFAMLILPVCLPATLDHGKYMNLVAAVFTNPLSFLFPSIFMLHTSGFKSVNSVISVLMILFSLYVAGDILYKTFVSSAA